MVDQPINQKNATPGDTSDRGLGLSNDVSGLLLDPGATKKDLALVRRAIKERWKVNERNCETIVDRMMTIIEKESIEVPIVTKFGIKLTECEGPADENAIAASKVIVMIVGQNQADEHKEMDRDNPMLPGFNVNVGVQVQSAVASEPEYLEWLRGRELSKGGNADAVGSNGFAATILGSASHSGS